MVVLDGPASLFLVLRKTAEKHMRLVQCIHFLIQYLRSNFCIFILTAIRCICVFVVEFSIFVACFLFFVCKFFSFFSCILYFVHSFGSGLVLLLLLFFFCYSIFCAFGVRFLDVARCTLHIASANACFDF